MSTSVQPRKILVVEGNSEECSTLARTLEAQGHRCLTADNGVDGLLLARVELPELIITDVTLPRMDGFELIERIRRVEELRPIPIIIVSAQHDRTALRHGMELGADDYARDRLVERFGLSDYARKKGDKLNWGAYGPGSTPHVLIETMAKQYGLKVEVVQYRGEAAMFADVAAQQLDGASGSPAAAAPVISSGKGIVIAVVGDRLPAYPDVPTMTEQGAVGGAYETRAFAAFAVPAATPPDIVRKLSDTLIEAGTDEKVKQLLANYLIVGPLSFEATNERFRRDTEVMLKVLKEIGLKPE